VGRVTSNASPLAIGILRYRKKLQRMRRLSTHCPLDLIPCYAIGVLFKISQAARGHPKARSATIQTLFHNDFNISTIAQDSCNKLAVTGSRHYIKMLICSNVSKEPARQCFGRLATTSQYALQSCGFQIILPGNARCSLC